MEAILSTAKPSLATDAYEPPAPPEGGTKTIMLGGAIKWWWQASCIDCGHWDDAEIMRNQRGCLAKTGGAGHSLYVWWNSIEHRTYVAWRDAVRAALIDAGYLTYAPWMAFKGTWNEEAQLVNDAALIVSDAFVVLSPKYAITEGTDVEREYAAELGIPVIEAPAPARDEAQLFRPAIEGLLAELAALGSV